MSKLLHKEPELIIKNGKPISVIIELRDYEEILERIEDIKDLEYLKKLRKNKLNFRRFEDFLKELQHV